MAWSFARKKKDMPDGLWMRCDECGKTVYRKDVEAALRVCPECGFHFSLSSAERIDMLLDPDSFTELFTELAPQDPLQFVDREAYTDRLKRYGEATGLKDAMVVGTGRLDGWAVALGVLDTRFMMGSLGSVMGEKIYRLAELAVNRSIPMILVCGSGGARMQEGVVALMQMAKTSAAIALCQEAGVATISLLTNPTTGGTTASFATETDVIVAEPGALIGFTGPRVIEETIKEKLPDGFQRSEFMLEHGLIDTIVARAELRKELARLIEYLQAEGGPPRQVPETEGPASAETGGVIGTSDQAEADDAEAAPSSETNNPPDADAGGSPEPTEP